ncbi:MAG: Uncharacterised protein [Cellulomonadaceae bacterium TMED98]|nr:MAG: Uncharacterised protein [Cellulomonadaceae bacterium TMED98]
MAPLVATPNDWARPSRSAVACRLVGVSRRIRSGDIPSLTSQRIRSVSRAVFPEPGAPKTINGRVEGAWTKLSGVANGVLTLRG